MNESLRNEKGATAPEYALMVGLIAAVIFAAVQTVGNGLNGLFTNAAGMFNGS